MIVVAPEKAMEPLPLLSPEERRKILVEWNDTARELPDRLYLHEMIEAQARATPGAIALTSETGQLTYLELDRRANALAHELVLRGVEPGSFVAVCMERSLELVVAVLAAWKAGAAFVALDTEYPPERLAMMLADSSPALLLTDSVGAFILGSHTVDMLRCDASYQKGLEGRDSPPLVAHPADAIACVLYTSGSTGVPKGVLSMHRGIANNLLDMQARYPLKKTDCTLQMAPLGFDVAAWELFWPLTVGARVYLARSGAQRDPDYIIQVLIEQNIASFTSTPAALQVMLDRPAFIQCQHIKMISAIGEVLSPAFQDRILSCMPQARLTNGYGPTEASITVTTWKCERQSTRRSVPIGRPQTNVEIYILDPGLEPVPIGVAGEIYIGGVAVSGGYLNRPELTAERFIPHPFRPESGERVYRTGDIARFGPDGVIEYIGRRDNQLKIRGVRVELGEIEATLDRLPAVKESVVVARDDVAGEKRLIAYVVLHDRGVGPLEIRRALESRLPPQFMPAAIIPVDAMPRNTNGKVDRAALADAMSSAAVPRTVNTPRSLVERQLVRIWQEMLDTPDVGIKDSFFDMGGHSLLAVVMLQRVLDEIGVTVSLRALYSEPTIEAMARSTSGNPPPETFTDVPPLLKLREGNGRAPFFYLNGHPPGTGQYVLELPRYLHPEQPIYIVHTPIFDGPVTVEGVAARLLDRIRAEVPTGPYVLGGNCLGAWLALEIGRQLIAAGERVPLVIILHPSARVHVHVGFRILRRLSLLAGVPEEFHSGEFASAGLYVASTTARILEELRRCTFGEGIDGCRKAGRWMGTYVRRNAGKPLARLSNPGRAAQKPHNCTVPEARRLSAEEQIEAHRGHWWRAWRRHEPRPYPGRVAIVWPTGAPGYPPWNARAGWAHLTSDLDWRVVPGDHASMMDEHLETTMRELNSCIEQVRQP